MRRLGSAPAVEGELPAEARKAQRAGLALLALAAGAAAGIGGFTFLYADGASYLRDDARACANCHVMREQLDGWVKGSHRAAATCNDCHTPHALLPKYLVKARNGFYHSLAFTTGRFAEPIRIKPVNRAVTQRACRTCHEELVQAIDAVPDHGQELDCLRCHAGVGHAR